jgi:hypothetical protein
LVIRSPPFFRFFLLSSAVEEEKSEWAGARDRIVVLERAPAMDGGRLMKQRPAGSKGHDTAELLHKGSREGAQAKEKTAAPFFVLQAPARLPF